MAVLTQLVAGWTGQLGPFTLLVNGAAFDLTGFTVNLQLKDYNGKILTPGGVVTIVNPQSGATKGQVMYKPVATDFVWKVGGPQLQAYTIHWQVIDGGGNVVFFPNGLADEIDVFEA